MEEKTFPKAVGSKFFPDGQVRPFPGNSIICHLTGAAALTGVLDRLHERLRLSNAARCYTLLPPSSWHMTVFDCVCDQRRETAPASRWPVNLARDIPLAEINERFEALLRAERFGPKLTFAMRIKEPRPLGGGICIDLEPAGAEEDRAIRALRTRIAGTLGFELPNPDTYTFHISLAYIIEFPSDTEKSELISILSKETETIRSSVGHFIAGPPEFCHFNDMFAFSRRLYLQ